MGLFEGKESGAFEAISDFVSSFRDDKGADPSPKPLLDPIHDRSSSSSLHSSSFNFRQSDSASLSEEHIVESGQTLSSIASLYYQDGNWARIVKANKLKNPDAIYEGQKLIIPSELERERWELPKPHRRAEVSHVSQESSVSTGKSHIVESGQILSTIANLYYEDGDWVRIAEANNLKNPDSLYIGQELIIPPLEQKVTQVSENTDFREEARRIIVGKSTEAPVASGQVNFSREYTIKPGDTLSEVAGEKLGSAGRWKEIVALNKGLNPDNLKAGVKITLPYRYKGANMYHQASPERLLENCYGDQLCKSPTHVKREPVSHSHFNDPIDRAHGRSAGNTRNWGDAPQSVQAEVIDRAVSYFKNAGYSNADTGFLLALIYHESGFNPDAASPDSSAAGVGQFTDSTRATLCKRDGVAPVIQKNMFGLETGFRCLEQTFIECDQYARKHGAGEGTSAYYSKMYEYHFSGGNPSYRAEGAKLGNRVAGKTQTFTSKLDSHLQDKQRYCSL